jgi:hypothetical protein
MAGQMAARVEAHYRYEMEQLAEDGCRIHYDMYPVRKMAPTVVQYRCHDSLDLGANHAVCLGSFSEGIDGVAAILRGTVGRVQVGCHTDCGKHSRESEGQIRPNWLGRGVWEVTTFVRLQLRLDQTPVVMGISVSGYHLCMDFCALLVEVESDFELGTHRARYLSVANMVF